MLSWNILKRAVTLIVDNLGAALRLTAVPYGLLAVVSIYFVGTVDLAQLAAFDPVANPDQVPDLPEGFWSAFLISGLVQLLVYLWIAVAWHRYVLLAEGSDGWVPPPQGGLMLGYLGRSILLGLLILAIAVAISVLLVPVLPVLAPPIIAILAIVVGYRLGLILPAGAIGAPMTMSEAWHATKGHSGTVVLLAVMTWVISFLLQIPALLDGAGTGVAGTGVIGVVYGLVVGWMLLMLGVSVLSTLYGHFVEKRPLD
ncbi:hypothetical protein MWU52_14455 [Jannaschia sp. S6380]|uniref:hypothetical protein n=1 Tax=Jannaschia sp. S6380 TaxID=2926408 RepID=UPI001FF68D93|nr:hypothetical protein [Jannaschia sp. S6380]MCK0168757.1 hypothetical protein [Jannaschia sp. S6380]